MSTSDFEDELYSDNDDDYYYQNNEDELNDDCLNNNEDKNRKNIEFFNYECISIDQAKEYINTKIENLSNSINVCYY